MKEAPAFKNDLLGVVLGGFCMLMLALAPWQIDLDVPYPFYKGPLLMPLIALSLGVLASIPSCVRLARRCRSDGRREHFLPPLKTTLLFFCALLYPCAIFLAGLEAATLAILALLLFINGVRDWRLLLFVPAGVTLIFWLVFRCLLDVFFPEPFLFYLLLG